MFDLDSNYICFEKIFRKYDSLESQCSCNVACNEFDFSSMVTTSTWPSNQYWFDMATGDLNYTLDAKDKKGKDALATRTKIQEDYTRADVYYQTLNVRSIIQNPAYPLSQLVPGIGGALSLYLGIAIVMAFEVLELIFDLMLALFRHNAKQ